MTWLTDSKETGSQNVYSKAITCWISAPNHRILV